MNGIILEKDALVASIKEQYENIGRLKYQRALLEFFDKGIFIGDNVFETSFKLRPGLAPLAYEVSGPYCAMSNEYATLGRIYENGQQIFESDIKQQIQQRTAAMVWLFLSVIDHNPKKILLVGAGKLALEIVHYLKHFIPNLSEINYHARNQRIEFFEKPCKTISVCANYQNELKPETYDTIIMATNTDTCLINENNIDSVQPGTAIVSLCTTSQTGEIAGTIYNRDDVNVMFDYDLTRGFTPDMQAADNAGFLGKVLLLSELLEGNQPGGLVEKKNILRLTGTPMQNVAVLDMMHWLENT
ncbi:MAG: hypothetical protein OQK51_18625 [Kangiellaceae bacterium]|nr:hypothetical protein [Kangiellaceae bacterium]